MLQILGCGMKTVSEDYLVVDIKLYLWEVHIEYMEELTSMAIQNFTL